MNETAIANASPLNELKPEFAPIVRHYPDTVNSFLRGYAPDLPDNYFKLLGWGETLEAAQAMARRAR